MSLWSSINDVMALGGVGIKNIITTILDPHVTFQFMQQLLLKLQNFELQKIFERKYPLNNNLRSKSNLFTWPFVDLTNFWALRVKSKAFVGQIWPTGHTLCMPTLKNRFLTRGPCSGPLGFAKITKVNFCTHLNLFTVIRGSTISVYWHFKGPSIEYFFYI